MRNTIPPKLTQRSNVNTPHSLQGKAYRDFCGPVGPIAQMLVVGSTALMKGPLTTLSRSQSCTDAYVLKLMPPFTANWNNCLNMGGLKPPTPVHYLWFHRNNEYS